MKKVFYFCLSVSVVIISFSVFYNLVIKSTKNPNKPDGQFFYDGKILYAGIDPTRIEFNQDTFIGKDFPFTLEGVSNQPNPEKDQASIYVQLVEGKHQLMVRFATGEGILLAREP